MMIAVGRSMGKPLFRSEDALGPREAWRFPLRKAFFASPKSLAWERIQLIV